MWLLECHAGRQIKVGGFIFIAEASPGWRDKMSEADKQKRRGQLLEDYVAVNFEVPLFVDKQRKC